MLMFPRKNVARKGLINAPTPQFKHFMRNTIICLYKTVFIIFLKLTEMKKSYHNKNISHKIIFHTTIYHIDPYAFCPAIYF